MAKVLSDVERAVDLACEPLMAYEDTPTQPLWHYCGAEGCKGIVADRIMFATHYAFTNDTEELMRGEELVVEVLRDLAHHESHPTKKRLYEMVAHSLPGQQLTDTCDVYLACFTAAPDANKLTQWSGYGQRGAGYALRLELEGAPVTPGEGLAAMLAEVVYDDDEFKALARRHFVAVADACAPFGSDGVYRSFKWLMDQTAAMTPRLKNACFAHESEWRLIIVPATKDRTANVHFRERGNNFVPYVRVATGDAVRQLVVGPAHAGEASQRLYAAKLLLEKSGYDRRLASASEIPFRG